MSPSCVVTDCRRRVHTHVIGPRGLWYAVCFRHFLQLKDGKQLVAG